MTAWMSWKALRWVGVAVVSFWMDGPVGLKVMSSRVRVARCSSRVWKLWAGVPSVVCWLAALWVAAGERRAGATGSLRWGGVSSVKVSGAHALRRCQTR